LRSIELNIALWISECPDEVLLSGYHAEREVDKCQCGRSIRMYRKWLTTDCHNLFG
jgi:hypothetical protein